MQINVLNGEIAEDTAAETVIYTEHMKSSV